MRRGVTVLAMAAALVAAGTAVAAVPTPTVSAPLGDTGVKLHHPQAGVTFDLKPFGYREDEYLVSGTATLADGSSPMPYSARIIVRRPIDAAKFNGSVLQEWFNVSLAHDVDVDWISMFPELMREGYAYVGVSAQPGDVPLQQWDPVRYAGVNHPGDGYADEIFAQVGQLLHGAGGAKLLARAAQTVIATGMSQSAERLHSYIKVGTDARDKVFDGFLIDRGVDGVGQPPFEAKPRVPTIFTVGEAVAEPDQSNHSDLARVWQISGSSHIDEWLGNYDSRNHQRDETGVEPPPWDGAAAGQWGEYGKGTGQCGLSRATTGSDMFPARYARDAALYQLNRWIRTGAAAAQPPLMSFDSSGAPARDADGNVKGGLRLPQIDVPVATYNGHDCQLLGKTTSFSDDELFKRYPTFADYSDKMLAATRAAVDHEIVRPCDAVDIMARVAKAASRWPADKRGVAQASTFTCTPRGGTQTAVGPAPKVCRGRTVRVRLWHRLRSGTVSVRGKRVRSVRRGQRRVRIHLTGTGRVTVTVRGRSIHGKRVVERHRYRVC